MKKIEENRYPNSATLFKFCKDALALRYEGKVKVIDQDVGAILGYDPADCSHWKKGKKNIRGLTAYKSLAETLNVDERLLIDIASGQVDYDEALFEYKGYGDYQFTNRTLDGLKKEYFKNPERWHNTPFESAFEVNKDKVVAIAEKLLTQGQFSEAPIYVPEILRFFPEVTAVQRDTGDIMDLIKVTPMANLDGESTEIAITASVDKPFMRYLILKELFKHLLRTKHELVKELGDVPPEVQEIQGNIFAGYVLVPSSLLHAEVEKVDSSRDIVAQLASTFWVSKSLLNQRLREFLSSGK